MRALALAAIAGLALSGPAFADQSSASGSVANAYAIVGGSGGSSQNDVHYSGSIENRSAPPLALSFGVANCQTAVQLGASFIGGAVGAGFASEDRDCTRRANAAALFALGRNEEALAVLANNEEVRRAIKDVAANRVSAPSQPASWRPSYCTPSVDETATDALMRRANCGK